MKISIRQVKQEDIKNIFDLSNDQGVRKVSLNKKPISWENHIKWFEKRLKSDMPFYIIEDENKDFIGQVRFEKENSEIIISISIISKYRSKRIGRKVIKKCIEKSGFKYVTAYIFDYNQASIKAFENADFINSHLLKYTYNKI